MSFFDQSSRFIQKNHMSPGPATYRTKAGFDAVQWKQTDVRSPDFAHRKRKSVQLMQSPHGAGGKPEKEVVIVQNGEVVQKVTQGAIMRELYGRLVGTIQTEIKGIKKGKFCRLLFVFTS